MTDTRDQAASGRLNRLHALRGIAAMMVLGNHLVLWDRATGDNSAFPPGPGLGWVGVDLFFVLSGFIIVHATRRLPSGPSAAAAFAVGRVFRIYPAYWAALAMLLAVIWLAPGLATHGETGQDLANALLLPTSGQSLIQPAWTLAHEVHFYLVFTLILMAPARWLPALAAGWAAFVATGAALSVPEGGYMRLMFNPLNLTFGFGVAIALAGERLPKGFAWPAVAAGALALAAGAAVLNGGGQRPGYGAEWLRLALCGVPAALVVLGLSRLDLAQPVRLHPLLARLGDWSYALYLVNLSTIWILGNLFSGGRSPNGEDILGGDISAPGRYLAAIAMVAVSLALAGLVHIVVEKPAIAFGKRLASSFRTPVLAG